MPTDRRTRMLLLTLLAVLLLAAIGYLLALRIDDARLVRVRIAGGGPGGAPSVLTNDPLPWLLVALAAGIAGFAGWLAALRALNGREDVAGERDDLREHLAEREAELEQARSRGESAEQRALDAERQNREDTKRRAAIERAWRSEREWNRELRDQLRQMHRRSGVLGRDGGVREMVLQTTMALLDAPKGMMLARDEKNSEGEMKIVCSEGFEQDPQHSAVAQRFAERVIERDTTVREDDSAAVDGEKRSPADEEISNLLAIPIYLQDEFHGVVICANRDAGFDEMDDEVLVAVGDHAGAVLENSRLHGDLRSAYLATVQMLADAIEVKDPQLRGHSDAVSGYVMAVADRMDFEPKQREELIFSSLLHDVGKLGISERILLKPGPLSDEERRIIQLHPRIGYHLISRVPALAGIAPAVLHHHERFDGAGYPERLSGQEIPLEARIVAVADTFTAMTLRRPYSQPVSVEDACTELERCAGTQFDPEVVRLFVEEVRARPPQLSIADEPTADTEELRHAEDEYVLGARSFGITDSLTLLYSRRHFHDSAAVEAQRATVQGRSFVILLAELQGLREHNEQRGYGAGDLVLQQAARAFQTIAAHGSGLAFRAGGSRLALMTDGSELDGGEALQAELTALLGDVCGASVVCARWRPGDDGEAVIARARASLRGAAPAL